jgi:hypothetical protein
MSRSVPPSRPRLTARGSAIQNVSFVILVALTTIAFLWLIASFIMPVFWAAVLGTVFFPLQRRYVALLGGRSSLAALATMLTIIAIVVVPLFFVGLAMSREAAYLHDQKLTPVIWARGDELQSRGVLHYHAPHRQHPWRPRICRTPSVGAARWWVRQDDHLQLLVREVGEARAQALGDAEVRLGAQKPTLSLMSSTTATTGALRGMKFAA